MTYSQDPKDKAERCVRRVLRQALRDAGCRDVRGNPQVARAARWIMGREQIESTHDIADRSLDARVRTNIRGLLKLYQINSVDPTLAYVALLDNWRLLLQEPSVTGDNLARARASFGDVPWAQMSRHVFALYAANPYLFTYDPIKAASAFKVNLVFMQSPFVSFGRNYTGSALRNACVSYIAGYFRKSSNIFARMVLAELSGEDPAAAHLDSYFAYGQVMPAQSLHLPSRATVSKRIAKVLGQDSADGLVVPPAWARTDESFAEVQHSLLMRRTDYERSIYLAFDGAGPAVVPQIWQFKIMRDLSPTGRTPQTSEEKKELFSRLIAAKIIKGYSFATLKR